MIFTRQGSHRLIWHGIAHNTLSVTRKRIEGPAKGSDDLLSKSPDIGAIPLGTVGSWLLQRRDPILPLRAAPQLVYGDSETALRDG